jgi:hypothetical protein
MRVPQVDERAVQGESTAISERAVPLYERTENMSAPTIHPTRSCFDDALDFIAAAVTRHGPWAVEHLRLVHAICRIPEGQHKAGRRFAHAWVEQDRQIVIQAGLIDGQKAYYGTLRRDHYRELRVECSTVYTVEEAWERNRDSNHYGPWEPTYRDLCVVA